MGFIPPRVFVPHYCLQEEEREAAAEKLMYPRPPSRDSQGNGPNPSFCESLLGSSEEEILKGPEEVIRGVIVI